MNRIIVDPYIDPTQLVIARIGIECKVFHNADSKANASASPDQGFSIKKWAVYKA